MKVVFTELQRKIRVWARRGGVPFAKQYAFAFGGVLFAGAPESTLRVESTC